MRAVVYSVIFQGLSLAVSLPLADSFPGHDIVVDNRTLDEIYAAAQKESGELTVFWGGDGNSCITLLVSFNMQANLRS